MRATRNIFVAIDFETSHYERDSACCVGLVRVEEGVVVARERRLIRPPGRPWMFEEIHGIRARDVAKAPTFNWVWTDLAPILAGATHLVAHNASFDRSVLLASCAGHGLRMPKAPFVCTVMEARAAWNLYPTKLPDVCAHLGIPLRHHDALSDAEAAAEIHLRATALRPG